MAFFRCGHCIHFAPTFKQLAADVYGAFFFVTKSKIHSSAMIIRMERCDGDSCNRLCPGGEHANMQGVWGNTNQFWKGDWSSTNFRWWGTPASSSSHRELLQGTWGRRELVGTSQFLLLRWGNGVDNVMKWDLNVIPPQKDMVVFLRELQVKKEKAGRGWPNLLPAEWVKDLQFWNPKKISFFYMSQGGEWKPKGSVGRWGSSSNNHGWRGFYRSPYP